MRFPLVAAFALITIAACSDGSDDPTPSPSTTLPEPVTQSPTPSPVSTENVAVFRNSADERVELSVEIADEPEERRIGLMNRDSLPENSGMLFVYDEDHTGGFWMQNTFIPLSIAFVLEDGTILDIQDMEPETTETHRPGSPYRHAIEANQGWFDRNGIAPGDTVDLPLQSS